MFNTETLSTGMTILFIALIIWSLIWKGLALYRAAQNNDKVWYVVMLILNTAGILEIIYYFSVGKKKLNK